MYICKPLCWQIYWLSWACRASTPLVWRLVLSVPRPLWSPGDIRIKFHDMWCDAEKLWRTLLLLRLELQGFLISGSHFLQDFHQTWDVMGATGWNDSSVWLRCQVRGSTGIYASLSEDWQILNWYFPSRTLHICMKSKTKRHDKTKNPDKTRGLDTNLLKFWILRSFWMTEVMAQLAAQVLTDPRSCRRPKESPR